MYEYESVKRVKYGDCGPQFVPVCEKCGRFVKPDKTITINSLDEIINRPNATCSKCGRVNMIFEGYL